MTTNNIEKLQIIATTTEGEYLLTISRSRVLIDLVAAMCEFHKVEKGLFEEYSLTELTDGQDFASDN